MRKFILITLICWLACNLFAGKPISALQLTFFENNSPTITDTTVAPNIWLYVSAGKSPTPFLSAGEFTAVWTGFISTDSRGDYSFQAELNGSFKLELNGISVLDVASATNSGFSKPIRLNRGTNALVATFRSPRNGDAFVRFKWKPKGSFSRPIPSANFSHFSTDDEKKGSAVRMGRELFVEHRCAKCHVTSETGLPELAMDAPSFEEIGERRNFAWMARWIEDPHSLRTYARMPKIFHGSSGRSDAEAVASFLATLSKSTDKKPSLKTLDAKAVASGKKLFAALHCSACHGLPEAKQIDPSKVSLKQVRAKFVEGRLAEFLKQPDLHYAWTRMPRFNLSDQQRAQLAAYLLSSSDAPDENSVLSNPETIRKGKTLLQTSGCLNCHSMQLKNEFSTKSLTQISNWNNGCLADKSNETSAAPQFIFSVEERAALQLFAASDRKSLSRHVPQEFAERQMRGLNCIECHGKIENVPPVEILGGKLKPEWTAKFLAGKIPAKPRPWVEAQMPALAKRAELLAEGMAVQHGISPQTPAEKPIDLAAAEIGRKLVSAPPLGFSCVTCHAVSKAGATQLFESPGINLAHSGERLLPDFFHRWLLNPSLIDPITKMPTYFDEEGKSPLTDVYDGDSDKQINAIWHYIRLGEKMPAPSLE